MSLKSLIDTVLTVTVAVVVALLIARNFERLERQPKEPAEPAVKAPFMPEPWCSPAGVEYLKGSDGSLTPHLTEEGLPVGCANFQMGEG